MPRASASTAGYDALVPMFLEAEPRFGELLDTIERLAPSLLAIGGDRPPAPRWRQDRFPRRMRPPPTRSYRRARQLCWLKSVRDT